MASAQGVVKCLCTKESSVFSTSSYLRAFYLHMYYVCLQTVGGYDLKAWFNKIESPQTCATDPIFFKSAYVMVLFV